MANKDTRVQYCCTTCDRLTISKIENFQDVIHHKCSNCIKHYPPQEENNLYVRCAVCGQCLSRKLCSHLRLQHNLTYDEYKNLYPDVTIISKRAHDNAVVTGGWIRRYKEQGKDLSDYLQKMSDAVKTAILSNPEELKRRSELAKATLVAKARSTEGRQLSSKTAKVTSARPDILLQRTERLHKLRCGSQPEIKLKEFLTPHDFLHSQHIKDESFTTKTHSRVLDFYNKELKTIIEFDGKQHFCKSFLNSDSQDHVVETDEQLNQWCVDNHHRIIRISYEYYSYRTKDFVPGFYDYLMDVIYNQTEDIVIKIGEAYNTKYDDKH